MTKEQWQLQKVETMEAIETIAQRLLQNNCNWHFHILTKDCVLNDSVHNTIVIENSDRKEYFVCHCLEKPLDLGKRLVKLLYGENMELDQQPSLKATIPSNAWNIIKRANELSIKSNSWHHHMLFPNCRFNNHQGKWTILFEDHETRQVLESVTINEPISELREIEKLCYGE